MALHTIKPRAKITRSGYWRVIGGGVVGISYDFDRAVSNWQRSFVSHQLRYSAASKEPVRREY
jgi:hypothetical protein